MYWENADLVAKGFRLQRLDYDDRPVKGSSLGPCALYAREGELIILHPSKRSVRLGTLIAVIALLALIGFGVALYYEFGDEMAAIATGVGSAIIALYQKRSAPAYDTLEGSQIEELDAAGQITRIYWSNVLAAAPVGRLNVPVIDVGDQKYRLTIAPEDLARATLIASGAGPPSPFDEPDVAEL